MVHASTPVCRASNVRRRRYKSSRCGTRFHPSVQGVQHEACAWAENYGFIQKIVALHLQPHWQKLHAHHLPPDHAEDETVEASLERLLGSAPRRNSLPRCLGDTPSEDANFAEAQTANLLDDLQQPPPAERRPSADSGRYIVEAPKKNYHCIVCYCFLLNTAVLPCGHTIPPTVQGGSAGAHTIVTALFRMLCKNFCCRKGLVLQARYWQQQQVQCSLWDPQQDH